MSIPTYIYDIECYRNYFLVMLVNPSTQDWWYWEMHNDQQNQPLSIPNDCVMIGFNSKNYDHPMLSAAMAGANNQELKQLNDEIILNRKMFWQHNFELWDGAQQIDIREVLPGQASLKIYGGRAGAKKLQDLPIDPDEIITTDMAAKLRQYCYNDCLVTTLLFLKIKPQMELRARLSDKYAVDLLSKSDAQIAEIVISQEYEHKSETKLPKTNPTQLAGYQFFYSPPKCIQFQSTEMDVLLAEIRNTIFIVSDKGKTELPENLKNRIVELGSKKYKMGIGGLHSVDKPGSYYTTDTHSLVDIDVTSYYPAIILNFGYEPAQMNGHFLDIYRSIVQQRLAAKKSGDKTTADSLKITINGSFGKLGSPYSKLYSPQLMIHVTLTGQLALLMLIEQLQECVISANTDGITLYYPTENHDEINLYVQHWEVATGFNMEWALYRSLHRRDVNNYVAIKNNLETKTKGIFASGGLQKNPVNEIITKAVIEKFRSDKPIEETIRHCNVLKDFTSLRTVNGGAVKNGKNLGKLVRWYWSTQMNTPIRYQKNHNIVPTSEHSRLAMDLPDSGLPSDIDYERYIQEAEKLYRQIK